MDENISIKDLIGDDGELKQPLPRKKKKPYPPDWKGCALVLLILVLVVVVGREIQRTLSDQRPKRIVVVDVPDPTSTPTPPPLLSAEPPPITVENAVHLEALARISGENNDNIAWSANGRMLVTGWGTSFYWYSLYQPVPLQQTAQLNLGDSASQMALSPDGTLLATTSYNHRLNIWSTKGLTPYAAITEIDTQLSPLTFSDDGRWLAFFGKDEDGSFVFLWDGSRRRLDKTIPLPEDAEPVALDFSPDGRWLVTASRADQSVRIWDVASGTQIHVLERVEGYVGAAAFSPDNQLLAYGDGNRIQLWDTQTQTQQMVLEGHRGNHIITSLSWTSDNQLLASGSSDGTVIVWQAATGNPLKTLEDDRVPHPALDVAFSPDARILAASFAGSDGFPERPVILWGIRE